MSVIIDIVGLESGGLVFAIVSGASSCLTSYIEWYLNSVLISTGNIYTLLNPLNGDQVYATVKDYATSCPVYWHNGQFYGGNFKGNFAGGTFFYGYLNGCQYVFQSPKPKPFIQVS